MGNFSLIKVKSVILKTLKKLDGEIRDVMHLVSLSMKK
jgi:hypothetical protein